MGVFQTMPISFGHFPSENPPTFPAQEPGKIPHFRRYFMKTGLTKRQKTTAIYFDEYSDLIEVQTHNTELKKRLSLNCKTWKKIKKSKPEKENLRLNKLLLI